MALPFVFIDTHNSNHGPGIRLSIDICYKDYVVLKSWPKTQKFSLCILFDETHRIHPIVGFIY